MRKVVRNNALHVGLVSKFCRKIVFSPGNCEIRERIFELGSFEPRAAWLGSKVAFEGLFSSRPLLLLSLPSRSPRERGVSEKSQLESLPKVSTFVSFALLVRFKTIFPGKFLPSLYIPFSRLSVNENPSPSSLIIARYSSLWFYNPIIRSLRLRPRRSP